MACNGNFCGTFRQITEPCCKADSVFRSHRRRAITNHLHSGNQSMFAGYFDLMPVRHKANDITGTLLLQDITVIALSWMTCNPIQRNCIGLLFCVRLIYMNAFLACPWE